MTDTGKFKVLTQLLAVDLHDMIRFQILNYCFINDIHLSPNQIQTLTYLGKWGDINISDFCQQISDMNIYSSSQTVRNFILDCVRNKIVVRKGVGDKIISITEDAELINEGKIFINLKVYTNGKGEESKGVNS